LRVKKVVETKLENQIAILDKNLDFTSLMQKPYLVTANQFTDLRTLQFEPNKKSFFTSKAATSAPQMLLAIEPLAYSGFESPRFATNLVLSERELFPVNL